MRVFVTGASGWIGSAIVPELIGAGHQVVGLARSDASAAALTAAGAEVRRGTLDDPDILRDAAAADRRAVETFGEALADSDRPFVLASGLLGLVPGRVATEGDGLVSDADLARPSSGPEVRRATAHLTLSLAARGVRSSVLRLPPTVHGDGDQGFMASIVGLAREKGVSGYL